MRRKYFRTLVALVLAVSLCLVMAVPALAADGTGTCTVDPTAVPAGSTENELTFTFTAEEDMAGGEITIEVPANWSPPQASGGTAGYTTATSDNTIGTLGFAAQVITVPITALDTGQTITVVYGNSSGGAGSGAIAQETAETVTFTTMSKVGAGGGLVAIVASPEVTVEPGVAHHFLVVTEHSGNEEAGVPFTVTLTAQDEVDNTAVSYTGGHVTSFNSTATAAPSGMEPVILASENISFTAGEGTSTGTFTLYEAVDTPIISAGDGTITGDSAAITVVHSDLAAYLVEPDAFTQIAGAAFSVNITAVDAYLNVVDDEKATLDGYTFTFSGPSDAPDGTAPIYDDSIDFVSGVWTASANLTCVEQVALTVTDNQTTPMFGTSDSVFVEGINLDSTAYNSSGTVTVTVGDQSKDTQTSIRAMSNSTDPDLIIIVIPENGAETGIFRGSFELVNGTPGTGQLYVEHGDNVTITYPTDTGLPVDPLNVADVDDVVPTITSFLPAASANITNATPEIAATLDDVDSDINPATIAMTVGGDTVVTSYNGTSGVVSYTPGENLTDGRWEVTVNVSDVAGNPAEQAEWSFTVDTGAPTITPLPPADGAYVNDNTPEISAVLENGGSGIDESTIVMTVDAEVVTHGYDEATSIVSYTPSDNLTEAEHTVTVDVSDVAGNPADQAEWSFTVDITDPVIAIGTVATPTIYNTQAVSGIFTETNLDVITLTVNDADVAVTANTTAGTWATTLNVTLTEGDNDIVATITDLAGNEASDEDTIVLDTVAPEVTDAEADPDVIQTATATPVTFSANVTDDGGSGVASVSANLTAIGGEEVQAMTDTGDGIYEFTWTDLTVAGADTYDLPITATDDAGNTNDTVNITLQVITDADDPVIESTTVEYPLGYESARVGDDVVITAVVTDNTTEIASVTIDATDIGRGDAEELIPTETADTYSAILTVGAGATVGTKTLTITATDLANHTDTDNVTVEVVAALTAYNLDLVEGWNLISLPLIPDDDSINVILADISDNVSQVRTWVYVDGVIDEKIWAEGGAVGVLAEMEDGQGYWIQMTEANTLTIQGVELPPPPQALPYYILHEGWNLIGFKSVDPTPVEYYLGTAVTEAFEVMYGYDAAGVIYTRILPGDLEVPGDELQPGQGYWLAVSAEGIIYP